MRRIAIATFFMTIGTSFPIYADETISAISEQQTEAHKDSYVPGMGEIMGATQMRHSKLWLAGKARNWDLASYELDEIKEGLDDAAKYHPVFKKDAPISAILEKFTAQPLQDIKTAIGAKDSAKFRKSFSSLTSACNACHQASSQGFIVIKQPGISTSGFNNQEFSVTQNRQR